MRIIKDMHKLWAAGMKSTCNYRILEIGPNPRGKEAVCVAYDLANKEVETIRVHELNGFDLQDPATCGIFEAAIRDIHPNFAIVYVFCDFRAVSGDNLESMGYRAKNRVAVLKKVIAEVLGKVRRICDLEIGDTFTSQTGTTWKLVEEGIPESNPLIRPDRRIRACILEDVSNGKRCIFQLPADLII